MLVFVVNIFSIVSLVFRGPFDNLSLYMFYFISLITFQSTSELVYAIFDDDRSNCITLYGDTPAHLVY